MPAQRRSYSGREERRDGVGVEHLGHHAVGVQLTEATVAVPVAVGVGVDEITPRVAEGVRPTVELVVPPGLEERLVVA
jgi:hypothetical protein